MTDYAPYPNLHTIEQFCTKHPAFKAGGVRWMIFHAATNGMAESGVVVRIGRRVLINEERFFSWVENQAKAHRA